MQAFNNNPSIKEKYLTRVQEHYKADEIIQGQYWENGKGCAVGCTIHSGNHENYELELGIPKVMAYLQDTIFEKLPNELAKEFPIQFLSSINVGADLKNVKNLFMIWLLTDSKYGVLQYADNKKIVQDIADAFSRDMVNTVLVEEWKELKYNATAAAYSDSKYDVYSSYSAAFHAAAYAAAYADSSYYADYSYYAAGAYFVKNSKSEWYIGASKELIELLKEAN